MLDIIKAETTYYVQIVIALLNTRQKEITDKKKLCLIRLGNWSI